MVRGEFSLARWRFVLRLAPREGSRHSVLRVIVGVGYLAIDVLRQSALERLGLIDLAEALSGASLIDAFFERILRCDENEGA